MAVQHVWSDEYQGARYVYHSPLRPISPSMVPDGFTVVLTRGGDPHYVTTTEPLPEQFVEQWSLELVTQ